MPYRSGLHVIAKDKNNERLEAFRRNIHFPELLFDLGLSGHREERFLIKVESQDQLVNYKPEMINIKGCGFFFPMSVPPSLNLPTGQVLNARFCLFPFPFKTRNYDHYEPHNAYRTPPHAPSSEQFNRVYPEKLLPGKTIIADKVNFVRFKFIPECFNPLIFF